MMWVMMQNRDDTLDAFKLMPIEEQIVALYGMMRFFSSQLATHQRSQIEWQDKFILRFDDFIDDMNRVRDERRMQELREAEALLRAKQNATGEKHSLTTSQRLRLKELTEEYVDWRKMWREKILPTMITIITGGVVGTITIALIWELIKYAARIAP